MESRAAQVCCAALYTSSHAATQILGHAPVLGLVLPRVLTVAAWLAAIGAVLDRREAEKKSA